MTPDIKELVKRLGYYRENPATGKLELANPNGPEAADALEALASEVETLNVMVTDWIEAFDKQKARAEAAEAERDRLKAVLKPRLNAKAIEGLQEILEAMEAMGEREAPFLKTLLDWHEAARKALGDAS